MKNSVLCIGLVVLFCSAVTYGSVIIGDATLSDSLDGWSSNIGGDITGTPTLTLDTSDKTAGIGSIRSDVTLGGAGTGIPYFSLSRSLSGNQQFAFEDVEDISFNWQMLTVDTSWAAEITFRNTSGEILGKYALYNRNSDYTKYWSQLWEYSAAKEGSAWTEYSRTDNTVTNVTFSMTYVNSGTAYTIMADDMELTLVPEPTTSCLAVIGGVIVFLRRSRKRTKI